jgi:hypothetical protein
MRSWFLYWVPIAVVAYALWGLFFGHRVEVWGLPITCWYGMGGVVGSLVLMINIIDRCEHNAKRRRP